MMMIMNVYYVMSVQKPLKTWDFKPRIRNIRVDQESDVLEDITGIEGALLIVHNDDVNTFDWVIKTLVELCGHSSLQAEQCAWIIHTKGKCQVKHGAYEDMVVLKDGIVDRGINATVE